MQPVKKKCKTLSCQFSVFIFALNYNALKNAVTVSILAVLTVVVSFLVYQNYTLNKKVEELSAVKSEASNTASTPASNSVDPAAESPFDKPNIDPLASKLPVAAPKNPSLSSVLFERVNHDFGKISDDEFVNTRFKFKNTGTNPLFILNAEGSCGCTVPRWPREPLAPGANGEIYVQFDSHGKRGEIEKTVTVTSNTTPAKTILTIKSMVFPKDK